MGVRRGRNDDRRARPPLAGLVPLGRRAEPRTPSPLPLGRALALSHLRLGGINGRERRPGNGADDADLLVHQFHGVSEAMLLQEFAEPSSLFAVVDDEVRALRRRRIAQAPAQHKLSDRIELARFPDGAWCQIE